MIVARSFVLVSFVFACGGPRVDAMRAAAVATTMGDAERGDAICGAGWKWNGERCIRSEEPIAGATTAKSGSLPAPHSKVGMEDLVPGTGAVAQPGDEVRVHYTGSLADGTVFDSSKPSGKPLEFRLGDHKVIPGFEQGIVGMKVGGTRKLTIPPSLGYGSQGAPPRIPANATLTFEIELVDTKP